MNNPNPTSVPNKLIPIPPIPNAPQRPSALDLPLPIPINLSYLSAISNITKDSAENNNSEKKKNIPKAPPLIFAKTEKKVVKTEIKNEAHVEIKKEVVK